MAWLDLTPTDGEGGSDLFNMDRVRQVVECGLGTQLIFGIDPSNGEVDCSYVRESKRQILDWLRAGQPQTISKGRPIIPQPKTSRT
jgi:hypothetical protein